MTLKALKRSLLGREQQKMALPQLVTVGPGGRAILRAQITSGALWEKNLLIVRITAKWPFLLGSLIVLLNI